MKGSEFFSNAEIVRQAFKFGVTTGLLGLAVYSGVELAQPSGTTEQARHLAAEVSLGAGATGSLVYGSAAYLVNEHRRDEAEMRERINS